MAEGLDLKCTLYITYDPDDLSFYPCQCPVCAGFLTWENDKPICNKCGAELFIIPARDEETKEELEYGKICPIALKKKMAGAS